MFSSLFCDISQLLSEVGLKVALAFVMLIMQKIKNSLLFQDRKDKKEKVQNDKYFDIHYLPSFHALTQKSSNLKLMTYHI
jgi:hypothetical protein